MNVLNGDGSPGLAAAVSTALVGGGFTAGTIGNSTQHSTTVSYGGDTEPAATAIARMLGGAPAATADTGLAPGTITVVLGKGFTPSATLTQQATQLTTTPTPTAPSSAPVVAGPQGLPVDGSGIPCVD